MSKLKIDFSKIYNYKIKHKSMNYNVTYDEKTGYIGIREEVGFLPDKIIIHKDILNAIYKIIL